MKELKELNIDFEKIQKGEFASLLNDFTNGKSGMDFVQSIYDNLQEITQHPYIALYLGMVPKEKVLGIGIHMGLLLARIRDQRSAAAAVPTADRVN